MSEEVKIEVELRKYLLGLLNAAQTEEIEKNLVSDEEYFQEIQIVEAEIIQDFVDEKLNQEEKKAFEENFIITDERREQINFARALRKLVDEKPKPQIEEKPSFFDSLKSFFLSPIPAICSVLVVAGISIFVWWNYSQKSEILVALNRSQKNERPTDARISDFDYAPKTEGTRGNDKTESLDLVFAKSRATEAVLKNPTAKNYHELGRVFLAEKNFDESIKQFEKAVKLNPNIAKLNNDLGVALMEKGRQKDEGSLELYARANESIEKSLELGKNLKEAYFNRALVIELLNLPNQAKEAWENYLKLDSTSKWADEARQRLKKLEANKPISKTKEEVLQDFLEAKQANDKEKAWQIICRNRSLSSGKLIPQQLAFLFVDSKVDGNEVEAQKALDALIYGGKLEEEKSGDLFWRNLANYYQNVSAEKIPKLKQAKDRYFQTILAKDATIRNADYKRSITELEEAKKFYLDTENNLEPKLIDFLIGYLINRNAKISESSEKLKPLAEFCKKSNYKWLESQAITWLATNYLSERKLSQAYQKTKEALVLSKETADLLNQQKNFAQISEISFWLGQFENAFTNIQKNIELGNLTEANLSEKWRVLNLISLYLYKLKRFDSNLFFEKEALTIARNLGDKTFEFTSLIDLGATYAALGDFDNALKFIEEGQKVSESFTDIDYKNKCLAHINLQLGHIKRQKKLNSEAIEHYKKAGNYYDSGDFQVYSYDAHRGMLLSSLADKNDSEFQTELPKILEIFKNYRRQIIEEQNRNSFFDNEQDVYDIATEYEFNKSNFENAFDYAEESRSRSLLDLQNSFAQVSIDEKYFDIKFSENLSEPLKLKQIQVEIPEETQLLVYSVLPEKVAIWLVAKDWVNSATSQIKSDVLQEKVTDYLKLVSKKSEPNEYLELSEELYNLLISPIKNKLEANKQLVIIPDKILFRLPFATLYSEKYLVEEYKISYSPSANVFLNCSRKAKEFKDKKSESLLSIGNPTFNQTEYENTLSLLPSAKHEAEEIAKLYETKNLLTEKEAIKEKVKESLKKADVFHFAGHYVVEEKTPLLSSLILAGKTKEESNLANYEIIGEKLLHTRLIVLSACDTGIERYYKGEGMIGASRTFLAINVPIVVASQWAVDSEATKELMIRFHKLRKTENISTAEALRQSQLEMLKDERFKQPYYWAAFVTLGGYTEF